MDGRVGGSRGYVDGCGSGYYLDEVGDGRVHVWRKKLTEIRKEKTIKTGCETRRSRLLRLFPRSKSTCLFPPLSYVTVSTTR